MSGAKGCFVVINTGQNRDCNLQVTKQSPKSSHESRDVCCTIRYGTGTLSYRTVLHD